MDRVLNPILSDRVVAFVNGAEHHGQFIFSTHNVLHGDKESLNQELKKAIPAFLCRGLLITNVQEAVMVI